MDLIQLDYYLFSLINGSWHTDFLDAAMPIWRNKLFWIPLYLFIASFLTINFGRKGVLVVLCLASTIVIADGVSSKVIKPGIERIRPCNDIQLQDSVRSLVRCGNGYSFTSSHATNHTAIAFFLIFMLGHLFKWIKIPLFLWAFSIGYGQIYVGVHYPLDVIGGMLVGFLIGLMGAEFCRTLLISIYGNSLET